MFKPTFAARPTARAAVIFAAHSLAIITILLVSPLPWGQAAQEGTPSEAQASTAADAAVEQDPGLLTVERIFKSGDLNAKGFTAHWCRQGARYEAWEEAATGTGRDLVEHDPASDKTRILVRGSHLVPAGQSDPLPVDDYQWSDDHSKLLIYTNSQRVWRQKSRGDYWVLDVSNYELRKLGGDANPATLMFAKFSPDGTAVAYVRERNIYVENLLDRSIVPITSTTSDEMLNGMFDWVYEEEFQIRDGFRWSPDGREIAYWQLNTEGVPKFTMLNTTDSFYPTAQVFAYPRTGEQNSSCRIAVANLRTRTTRWVELPGDDRNHYVPRIEWIPAERASTPAASLSNQLVIQQLNRLQNSNRVFLLPPDATVPTEILVDQDEAWVDVHDELMWLDEGRRFTWVSERDGWRHLYVCSVAGGPPQLVTPGDFDVLQLLRIDETRGWLYLLASPHDATQKYLYRVRLDGSGIERLTPSDQPGTHDYDISADATLAVHTWSQFATPPRIELVRLSDHGVIKAKEDNSKLRETLATLRLGSTEMMHVEVEPGVKLDGWSILPPDFDASRKYPLLIHVYGEPAGQTVLDRWGGSGYLWHQLLAQRGCVIMSFDNRGTPAAKGRAWRKCIYEQVGVLAAADQAAAVRRVLQERTYLDASRVGVWGWSGGGSMTLNALFKFPDLYRAGISIAPVPNQRFYDTIYQERYMGLPSKNVEGYLQGSPIHFAHQLRGSLLLVHGTGDDNCHYQTTEMLINELVRFQKQFQLMSYPTRTHAIREGEGTTIHLREMMTRFLVDQLLSP